MIWFRFAWRENVFDGTIPLLEVSICRYDLVLMSADLADLALDVSFVCITCPHQIGVEHRRCSCDPVEYMEIDISVKIIIITTAKHPLSSSKANFPIDWAHLSHVHTTSSTSSSVCQMSIMRNGISRTRTDLWICKNKEKDNKKTIRFLSFLSLLVSCWDFFLHHSVDSCSCAVPQHSASATIPDFVNKDKAIKIIFCISSFTPLKNSVEFTVFPIILFWVTALLLHMQ